jgi:predicted ATP-grasp superfamily ATP-dependent carboligase
MSSTLSIVKSYEMQIGHSAVPVVAMGSGLTLNGVIRILGRTKLPVYCICPSDDFVAHSRWYRKPPLDGASELAPFELETLLRTLPLEEAVLMPCSDDWLQATACLPPSLARRFHSSLPSSQVVETMLNKWRFAQLLDATGTPHPQTILLRSAEDLRALPESSFGIRIFKPMSSLEFATKHGVKGYVVQSRAEALRVAAQLEFPIMLQEYIPGPPTESYFVDGFIDYQGRVCARFARQRIRMFPRDLGNSSLTMSIPLQEIGAALTILDRLFARVAYRGIFSAEFKHDGRDGLFKLLEINARPWWYIEFAARCGVDVCGMSYADALGLPVEPVDGYQIGRHCTFLPHDICAYRDLEREDGFSLWRWIRSWAGGDDALFAWDDVGPAIAYVRHVGGRRLQRMPCWSKAA